jgi:transposase
MAKGRGSRWLIELLKRKTPKLAAVALANKMARIAWKLMTTGETYDRARLDARADAQGLATA